MQFIDDAEFQVAIDLDGGGKITSVKWREMEFTVPFRGSVLSNGWYPMAPWAGRIRDGLTNDEILRLIAYIRSEYRGDGEKTWLK